jgi:ribonuclease D
MELARRLPKTLAQLQQIRDLPNATRERHGPALLDQIASACSEPPEQGPTWARRPRLTPEQAARVEHLLEQVAAQASHYHIPLSELAERRDVERLVAGEDCRLLHGWRARVMGLD